MTSRWGKQQGGEATKKGAKEDHITVSTDGCGFLVVLGRRRSWRQVVQGGKEMGWGWAGDAGSRRAGRMGCQRLTCAPDSLLCAAVRSVACDGAGTNQMGGSVRCRFVGFPGTSQLMDVEAASCSGRTAMLAPSKSRRTAGAVGRETRDQA